MAKSALLQIEILATAKEALEQFDKVKEKSTSSYGALKAGALVAAGAVVGVLGEATKAAADHQVNVAKLEQAYKDAGISTKDMGGALEEIEARSRRTGQSTEENIAAYTKLVAATKDTKKASEELAIAQDLAAFKGISVTDAASAITKATQGSTKALKDLGISTKDAGGHALSTAELMDQLKKAVAGQADAVGNTAVGQFNRYKESMDQAKVAMGEALLPAIQQILATLQPLFNWLDRNRAVLQVLAPVLAILAGVILGVSAALRAWAVIQAIVNALMSANPVGIVIISLAALVAIIILVVAHWNDVKRIVDIVWGALRDAGAWILGNWPYIIGAMFGPLGLLVAYLARSTNAIHDVIAALQAVGRAVNDALGFLSKLPANAGSILGKLNPFSLPGGGGAPAPAPVIIAIQATPGDDLPDVVYNALRRYQHQHRRPELRPLFG